jgi:hypothetical protein
MGIVVVIAEFPQHDLVIVERNEQQGDSRWAFPAELTRKVKTERDSTFTAGASNSSEKKVSLPSNGLAVRVIVLSVSGTTTKSAILV